MIYIQIYNLHKYHQLSCVKIPNYITGVPYIDPRSTVSSTNTISRAPLIKSQAANEAAAEQYEPVAKETDVSTGASVTASVSSSTSVDSGVMDTGGAGEGSSQVTPGQSEKKKKKKDKVLQHLLSTMTSMVQRVW